MIQWFVTARDALDGIRPGLFNAALAGLVWVGIWLVRKVSPALFSKIPEAWQAGPALVLSGLVTAVSTPLNGDVLDAAIRVLTNSLAGGLISGLLAVGTHHALKASPLPYGNPPKEPEPPASIGPAALLLLVLTLLPGCAASFEESRQAAHPTFQVAAPSTECVSIDSAHRDWSAVAATAGLLAGGSGLGQIPEDSTALRIGLAAGTVSMAALAVFATKESDGFAAEWAASCAGVER